MRLYVAVGVFALAVLAAACGGGGKSGLPSVSVLPTSGAPAPPNSKSRRLGMTVLIPPPAHQSAARRPFYISPSTLSFAIAAVPVGTTPKPSQLQIFPVATPSPCATVSAGGETCTFIVQAPIGNDQFYMAAFAVASPNPNTTPLSTFVSGSVAVGATPGPNATPLAFTLNGVVNSVTIAVPNPDPNNTPNTQLFTVEVAATTAPLQITPVDVSGNPILSDAFNSPITLNVTPANQGVSLVLTNPTCPTSSATTRRRMQTGSPTVSIGCPSDLGALTVAYDGSVIPDSLDHIVDAYAVTSNLAASPAPSPAVFQLMGNLQNYVPNSGGVAYNNAYLQAMPNNVVAYLLNNTLTPLTTAGYGTINVNTGAVSTPVTFNATTPAGFYVMSDGTVWVADSGNNAIECYNPTSGAQVNSYSLNSTGIEPPTSIVFDGANIWVAGEGDGPAEVAWAPLTASCTIGSLSENALPGSNDDAQLRMVQLPGGGVALDGGQSGGFWTATTSGANYFSPGFTIGNGEGGGIGIDGTGKVYAAFSNLSQNYVSLFNGTALTQLNTLPTLPGALAPFGPSNGTADRIVFAGANGTVGGILSPNGSNTVVEVIPFPNAGTAGNNGYGGQNAAFSTLGADFVAYINEANSATTIGRVLLTDTWTIPQAYQNTTIVLPFQNLLLGIAERGDSGPFTVVPVGTPPSCYPGISQVPGFDHEFVFGLPSISPCTVTLKVTDKNGRSQVVTVELNYIT